MSLLRRLDKLEKHTHSKYTVGLFVETTPDGRCEIKEQLYWDFANDGRAKSYRFRKFTIDSFELYEPPFNAEISYIIGGMNEIED
jgi:hypothetical protein